jgi:hypothetical protein
LEKKAWQGKWLWGLKCLFWLFIIKRSNYIKQLAYLPKFPLNLSIIEHFIAVPGLPNSIISDEDIILSVVKIQFLITDFFWNSLANFCRFSTALVFVRNNKLSL